MPLIQELSKDEREQLRRHLETDSDAWREKWEKISAHFHDAFANTPEDEVIRDFDEALGEVRRERSGETLRSRLWNLQTFSNSSAQERNPKTSRGRRNPKDIEFVIEEFLFRLKSKENPAALSQHLTPLQIMRLDNLLSTQPRADEMPTLKPVDVALRKEPFIYEK